MTGAAPKLAGFAAARLVLFGEGGHGAMMEARGLGVTDDDLRLVVDGTTFTRQAG